MSREKLSRREAFKRLAGLAALPVAVSLPSKPEIHRIEPVDSPLAKLHRDLFESHKATAKARQSKRIKTVWRTDFGDIELRGWKDPLEQYGDAESGQG